MTKAIPEPLRMLDVPDSDGSAGPNSWALVSQSEPRVYAGDRLEGQWSHRQSDALVLPFQAAVAMAQQLTDSGIRVALVRNNSASWEWLGLVTDWTGKLLD
jgi:hypothetical protein